MPEDCNSFQLSLRFQYAKLLSWGDAVGLNVVQNEAAERILKMNRTFIFALLSEIKLVVKGLRRLGLAYDDIKWEDVGKDITQPQDTTKPGPSLQEIRDVFESSDVSGPGKKHNSGLNHLVNIASGLKSIVKKPKRIRWALRDREKFEKDLERLAELNDYLHESLDDRRMEELHHNTEEIKLAILQLAQSVTDIETLLHSKQIMQSDSAESDSASFMSQAPTIVDPNIPSAASNTEGTPKQPRVSVFDSLALFRKVYLLSITSQTGSPGPQELKKTLQILDTTDRGTRSTAKYDGRSVWVEWKAYQQVAIPSKGAGGKFDISPDLLKDVRWLVALLQASEKPSQFCVPSCLGYTKDEDETRVGLIYEAPNAQVKPISLLQLFSTKTPALQDRIRLAQRLATCLLYLHAVSWLHKALRSASILFFSSDKTDCQVDIGSPSIGGFGYSRPDTQGRTTIAAPQEREWAVYCHPDYLGSSNRAPYVKPFDIYSLGIILIEIANWKSAEELFGFVAAPEGEQQTNSTQSAPVFNKTSLKDLRGIRDRILTSDPTILEHVRVTMGERYHNAVRACISGLDQFGLPRGTGTEPVKSALIQHAYIRQVVDVLEGIEV
jgi:hypothetical protein